MDYFTCAFDVETGECFSAYDGSNGYHMEVYALTHSGHSSQYDMCPRTTGGSRFLRVLFFLPTAIYVNFFIVSFTLQLSVLTSLMV